MGRPRKVEEPWYQRVAVLMVREGKTMRQAAMECDLALTVDDCIELEKKKDFQKVLWTERHRFYQELAKDPERSKISLIGQMMFLVQKLTDEGSYEKALEGIFKLMKAEGFIGPENQINLFNGVTPKDLEEAKAKIAERLKQGGSITQGLGSA